MQIELPSLKKRVVESVCIAYIDETITVNTFLIIKVLNFPLKKR